MASSDFHKSSAIVGYSRQTVNALSAITYRMLGEELRTARSAAGMTQEALSFASGVDRTYISELENGRKSPTVDVLLRLCAAMGVKASHIIANVEGGATGNKNRVPNRRHKAGSSGKRADAVGRTQSRTR